MKSKAGSGFCTHCVECFTLAWTAGLLTAFLQAERYLAAVLPTALLLTVFSRRIRHLLAQYRAEVICICCGLLFGAAAWLLYDLNTRLPLLAMDGRTVGCTGRITDIDRYAGDRSRYTLRTSLEGYRVSVDWYAGAEAGGLQIGDTVTLRAKLTRIRNDYRYHTAEYQAGLGRYLRIYSAELLDTQQDDGFSLRRTVHAYRAYITGMIERQLTPEEAGLMCAMLFGDKSGLSDETAESLYQTGIGHVTAVSGLHLVFFCTLLMHVFRRLKRSARMLFRINLAAIFLFIILVDASVSVYRAALMMLLSQSAVLFGRYGSTLRSLCIAMFLCTVGAPYVIGSISFWLSVSGVLGIGVIAPYMTRNLTCGRLPKLFLQLCCVAVTVFPASVLLCGESSLLSPVCNLLILPFSIAALYIGLLLLCSGGLTAFLLPVAGALCRFVRITAGYAAKLPFSHLTVSVRTVRLTVVLCTVLLLLLAASRIPPKQLAAAALLAAVILVLQTAYIQTERRVQLQIAVLGDTQQAALVISAGGRTIVADLSGAVQNPQYVAKYLADFDITQIDELILNGSSTAAAYQAELYAVSVSEVCIQNDTAWRNDLKICGVNPVFCGDLTMTCGALELNAAGDALRLAWHGYTVAALPAESDSAETASVVIRYGGTPAQKDTCSLRIISAAAQEALAAQEFGGNNLLLRITANGKADVQPLDTYS